MCVISAGQGMVQCVVKFYLCRFNLHLIDLQLLFYLFQLQKVDLSIDNLICFDEIIASLNYNPESTVHEQNMKLTLCDHNALAADLEPQYGPSVVEIIDHHVDRGYYPWIDNGSGDRSIAFSQGKPTAMSTCTLVAEAFLSNLISRNFLTEEVATLLMAVIAVDSSNLVNATDRDNNAVKVCAFYVLFQSVILM